MCGGWDVIVYGWVGCDSVFVEVGCDSVCGGWDVIVYVVGGV